MLFNVTQVMNAAADTFGVREDDVTVILDPCQPNNLGIRRMVLKIRPREAERYIPGGEVSITISGEQ